MLIILSLLLLILNCFIVYYEWKIKSIGMFISATLLIMFSIPHFFSIILGTKEYANWVLNTSSLFAIGFLAIYILILYVYLKKKKKDQFISIKEVYTVNGYYFLSFLSVLVCSIGLLMVIIFLLDKDIPHSFTSFRRLAAKYGILNPIRFLDYIYFSSAGLMLIYLIKKRKALYVTILLPILYYSIFRMSRMLILPVLVALIIYFSWYHLSKISSKILIAASFGILGIYTVYFLRLSRMYGTGINFIFHMSPFEIFSEINGMILSGDGELGLRNIFYYFIENNNNFPNFGEFNTYKRLVLMLVPTSFSFGLKPSDFAISMGQAWSGNYSNIAYSAHPTLFGDAYANLGNYGVLIGGIWASIVIFLNNIISRSDDRYKPMWMVLIGSILIIIARGSIYNGSFSIMMSGIVLYSISKLTEIFSKKVKHPSYIFVRNADYNLHSSFSRTSDMFSKKGENKLIIVNRNREIDKSIEYEHVLVDDLHIELDTINLTQGEGFNKVVKLLNYNISVFKLLVKYRSRYNCIYVVDLDSAIPVKVASILFRKDYIYHIADYYADSKLKKPSKITYNIVKKIESNIMKSSYKTIICTEKRLQQIQPYNETNIQVIHNAPVIDSINIITQKPEIGRLYLGYVGSLDSKRFIDVIIKVVAENENIELNIAGHGPLSGFVSDYSKQYTNIKYHGPVNYSDSFNIYSKSDIILCIYDPSVKNHIYSAPNKFYEALALDKALIVANHSGVDEMVKSTNNGFIINYQEADLSTLLNSLLNDKDLVYSKIKNGEKAKEFYSWKNQRNLLINLFMGYENEH